MTKYVIVYKNGDKWVTWAVVTSRAKVPQKIADLYEFNGAVEKIQIQKVVK